MSNRILVTGASIAGNATAWWLARYGFDVTVVERMPKFRDGGHNIDVRGVGREILRLMGLERTALDHGTGEAGTVWVDDLGDEVAKFVTDLGSDGPTAEMEILRGDLARLLYEPARGQAAFQFAITSKRSTTVMTPQRLRSPAVGSKAMMQSSSPKASAPRPVSCSLQTKMILDGWT